MDDVVTVVAELAKSLGGATSFLHSAEFWGDPFCSHPVGWNFIPSISTLIAKYWPKLAPAGQARLGRTTNPSYGSHTTYSMGSAESPAAVNAPVEGEGDFIGVVEQDESIEVGRGDVAARKHRVAKPVEQR